MIRNLSALCGLGLVASLSACATEEGGDREEFDFGSELGAFGKADMLKSAHIVREADLNATFTGNFDRKIRVYGFSVEAKVGAILHVDMITAAGPDSFDVEPGDELDTIMAVYGPTKNGKPGPLLTQVDDDDTGLAAQLPPVEIEEEGEYLVLLSSWNDPGAGQYIMDLKCEGTDFQCQRPVVDAPCVEGTEYILGGQSVGTTTWSRCNYVLLEETHVEPEAVLTINPGVTVQGNFLGEAPYGDVGLVVDGVVQAVGSEDHPVVFTALKDGWAGLTLNGNSTLHNVFVEKAEVGVTVVGDGNQLRDININTSETGIRFVGETEGHSIVNGHIAKVTNGIEMEETVVKISDTVLLGDGEGIGVLGTNTAASFFERALVSGFGTGIDLTSAELEMVDATISRNARGVRVTGEDAGVSPAFTCPPPPQVAPPPPRTWPPAPNPFRRDPIFRHVDIVDNAEYAVSIEAPELLIIEHSNVVGNGQGIVIASNSLHDDSRINANNIHENGPGLMQLETFHNEGVLDISGNYWAQISDPELSESWSEVHDNYVVEDGCERARNGTPSGCTCDPQLGCNTRLCQNDYTCTRRTSSNTWDCVADAVAEPWSGDVEFTGFSPIPLDAGPRTESLSDDVKQQRQEQGL